MSYSDIILDNRFHHSPVRWWPKFAFHYTDVTNAVSILDSGMLFSRSNAEHLGLMHNDNASRQVIDMTQAEAQSCVRFYFRPLTPTQYYNEGFKHIQLRYDDDENANTPVPIFFLFDLAKLLSLPGVRFSEQKQAGYGSTLLQGEDDFAKMNFDYIYSIGPKNIGEMKPYRHAEILHQNSMPIDTCLRYIGCRNKVERLTLMNRSLFNIGTECIENNFEEGLRRVSNSIGWLIIYSLKQTTHPHTTYLIKRAQELFYLAKKMDVSKKTQMFLLTLFTTVGSYCCKDPSYISFRDSIIDSIKDESIERVKIAVSLRTNENGLIILRIFISFPTVKHGIQEVSGSIPLISTRLT